MEQFGSFKTKLIEILTSQKKNYFCGFLIIANLFTAKNASLLFVELFLQKSLEIILGYLFFLLKQVQITGSFSKRQ